MATIRKRKGSTHYSAGYVGPNGLWVLKSTGTTDRTLAMRIAREWESDAAATRSGTRDLVADRLTEQGARSVTAHLADFIAYLSAKGSAPATVGTLEARSTLVIEQGKIIRLADLTPSRVIGALDELKTARKGHGEGLASRTIHHYSRAMRGFSRWLFRDHRTAVDALAGLAVKTDTMDRRRTRRELTADELTLILKAAEACPYVMIERRASNTEKIVVAGRVKLTCPHRAWSYRVAAATGLRASEVSSLTRASFDLEGDSPTVTCTAGYTKNGREARQPIHPTVAAQLAPWLDTRPEGVPVCPVPTGRGGAMLAADMEAARALWIDAATSPAERAERVASDFLKPVNASRHVADFHSLRTTYISGVVRTGANLKTSMELARHSDARLTLNTYAKLNMADVSAALPPATGGAPEQAEAMRATGTDGKPPAVSGHRPVTGAQSRTEARKGAHRQLRFTGESGEHNRAPSAAESANPGEFANANAEYPGCDSNARPLVSKTNALSS